MIKQENEIFREIVRQNRQELLEEGKTSLHGAVSWKIIF